LITTTQEEQPNPELVAGVTEAQNPNPRKSAFIRGSGFCSRSFMSIRGSAAL